MGARSVSVHVKAGVQLDKFKSTPADICKAVQTVLYEDSFSRNAEDTAEKMARNAQMRLKFLGSELEPASKRVGVPVAAAVIIKSRNGENPAEVLPPALRPPVVAPWFPFC